MPDLLFSIAERAILGTARLVIMTEEVIWSVAFAGHGDQIIDDA